MSFDTTYAFPYALTSAVLTDLVHFCPSFEVVTLVSAVEQLKGLVHVVPGVLDLDRDGE